MNPWRGVGSLPREVWILSATNLINRLGMMGLPYLVIYLTGAKGYTPGEAGIVLSVYGLSALVTSPFAGRLSDAIGPLRVMKLSLLFAGVILLLFPLANSPAAILIATVLWSATGEAFRPASLAVISDHVEPARRRTAFSVNRLALNLGVSVGPAMGGFLILYSFPLIFWVNGATTLLAALLLSLLMKRGTGRSTHPDSMEAAQPKGASVRTGTWTDRRLLYFLTALLPVFITFFQHASTIPLVFMRDMHQPASSYGLLFTVNTLLIVLIEIPLNVSMSRWPHRTVLALGAMLVGLGFGAMMFATDFLTVALTVVVWTFGEMILLPGAAAYVADIAPEQRRGSYMGAYQMMGNASFALGPWVGTAILERFGASTLWSAVFFACSVCTILLMRIPHGEERVKPAQELSLVEEGG